VQRHLAGNPRQRLHQEVYGAHPGLDRAEEMLDRLASLAHLLRMLVQPTLHSLEVRTGDRGGRALKCMNLALAVRDATK
jgi:hypothetical protein